MSISKLTRQKIKYFQENTASFFLILLFSADLIFIFLHLLHVFSSILKNNLFSISIDFGYPEVYQYIKEFWMIILMFFIFFKSRQIGYFIWSILFVYLLCDDALQIHEKVGSIIASNLDFNPLFGLRAVDYGEIAVTAIAGAFFLSFIGLNYLQGSSTFKRVTQDLFLLLLMLAFFGIFTDMLHVAVLPGKKINSIIGVIEDGGEMIVISLMTWYIFLLAIRKGCLDYSLGNLLSSILYQK
ncbi:MAG: hypothetical protein QNJ46_08840 [Leptolyngbyaceae cyanobacterium MO_188.B28]|nr:hypothetical protein [Leptolyngbyaceae cyanobacterium MO_188.B28]